MPENKYERNKDKKKINVIVRYDVRTINKMKTKIKQNILNQKL